MREVTNKTVKLFLILSMGILSLIPLVIMDVAFSADLCKAIALRDIAPIESSSSVMPRGEYQEAVTQYVVDKRTGTTSFCSHGGFCYPTHVYIDGKKIEALQLVNCKVGDLMDDDEAVTIYSIVMDRSKNTPEDLLWDDIDNKLLGMGLGSACASHVTEFYTKKPSSPCAKLAKKALEGDTEAIRKLITFPDFCKWVEN
jgi:hypothetical protein